jgi:hypothetical protein
VRAAIVGQASSLPELAGWKPAPRPVLGEYVPGGVPEGLDMMRKLNERLTTVAAVVRDHGGDEAFWSAWVLDELTPAVRDWVRGQAAKDPKLRRDLASIESPSARAEVRQALEATNYLARPGAPTPAAQAPRKRPPAGHDPGGFPLDELTYLVVRDSVPKTPAPTGPVPPARPAVRGEVGPAPPAKAVAARPGRVYRYLQQALFRLLQELELSLPAGAEAREATCLLRHLVGPDSVAHFRRLTRWLEAARARATVEDPPALDRLLGWLTPELFERASGGYAQQPSFRLYLRALFRGYAEGKGWTPHGPRHADLGDAFAALTRERIGELVREAVTGSAEAVAADADAALDAEARQVLEGVQLAYREFLGAAA